MSGGNERDKEKVSGEEKEDIGGTKGVERLRTEEERLVEMRREEETSKDGQ